MSSETLFRSMIAFYETGIKRRRTFRYWRELESSQWLPGQKVEHIQFPALRALIANAFLHCPYYAEQWRALGLDPGQLDSCDMRRWPVIDRDTIRRHRQAMQSTAPGMTLWPKATGGSSGVPLQFDLTPESNERRMAAFHRGYAWAGAAPGTKQLYLWGVPLDDRTVRRRSKDFLYNRVLYRRKILNTFDLSDQRVPYFVAEHNRYRPEVVVAYTNPLYYLARALRERKLTPFPPRSIVIGAEKLHDFQRQLIEEVFQAPVFETYGCREFMLIGAECDRHEGLHLTAENLLVEILDDDGQPTPDGQEGNVVITDLYNYGMPFIRYANGDRAIAGWRQCSCGRGLPLLTRVTGRSLDVLATPDGRRIPGEFFPHLLKDYRAIERFQVVQERPDLIAVRVVTNKAWQPTDESRIVCEVRKVAGTAVRVLVERVDDIPLTRSGKLHVVVNRCQDIPKQLSVYR